MNTARVRRRGVVASVISGVVVSFVVLGASACTAPAEPIPGLTDAELKAYAAEQREDYWEGLGLPRDMPKLEIEPIAYVDQDEWGNAQTECIEGLRAGNLSDEINERLEYVTSDNRDMVRENLWWFICDGQYPLELDDIGMLSGEQLEALYEHFQKFTVPCLNAKGYRVNPPPALKDFTSTGWLMWSPVDNIVLSEEQQMTGLGEQQYKQLAEECQAQPRVFFGEPWWLR